MESIDKKTNINFNEQKEVLDSLKKQIIYKKSKLEEEFYHKSTLQSLVTKMQDDLLITKKQITDFTKKNERSEKEIENEKFRKTSIKEKTNSVHSRMLMTINKNLFNKREHEYLAQYYSTVIDQKSAFHSLM